MVPEGFVVVSRYEGVLTRSGASIHYVRRGNEVSELAASEEYKREEIVERGKLKFKMVI